MDTDRLIEECRKYAETPAEADCAGVCTNTFDLGDCEIDNIVVTAQLEPKPRDVEKNVQLNASDSRFRPWILVKFYQVKCTCLVFGSSGMCVFVGIKKHEDIILVTQMLVMYIWRTKGHSFFVRNIAKRNIVGDGKLPGRLDVVRMARENPHLCVYQPSVYPGLRFCQDGSVNAYASGCFVCPGEPTRKRFLDVIRRFKEVAHRYITPPP